jgi:hypothetical protein
MGKSKAGEKAHEGAKSDNNIFVAREELEKLSMDMQRKLDDFANGQLELSRQQTEASNKSKRRFDQITALLFSSSYQ